jgi:hypothetical protein
VQALMRLPVVIAETLPEDNVDAWDSGPVDNDAAADWGFIRDRLTTAVDSGDIRLGSDAGIDAIAMVVVVASHLPGGEPLLSFYAPDSPPTEAMIDVPDDIPPLALRVLDNIVGDDSEWHDLWNDAGSFTDAAAAMQTVRAALQRVAG